MRYVMLCYVPLLSDLGPSHRKSSQVIVDAKSSQVTFTPSQVKSIGVYFFRHQVKSSQVMIFVSQVKSKMGDLQVMAKSRSLTVKINSEFISIPGDSKSWRS